MPMRERQIKFQKALNRIYERLNSIRLLQAVKGSLVMIIPVIMVGAFTIVLRSLPVPVYQTWLHGFADGAIDTFFGYIHQATFGILSLYMVVSLAFCYASKVQEMSGNYMGTIISSILTFFIFSGIFNEGADVMNLLGANGLFTAIISTLFANTLYFWLNKKIRIDIRIYTSGTDDVYFHMLRYILPILIIGVAAASLNLVFYALFGVQNFQDLYILGLSSLFQWAGRNFGSTLLYVFMVHFLWFFGIHGGNVLDSVWGGILDPGVDLNVAAVAAGNVPTEIYSKSFLDIFVIMGGCGSTLCLLAAILLFERKRGMRKLARFAAVPSLFNINELLLFGVPIVYNPIMLIPFFLTPIVNLLISTAAMKLGLVPVVAQPVEWTTPIFLGGYYATGSIAGSILQGVNLCVGVMIYRPFVRLMHRENARNSRARICRLVELLQESEDTRVPVKLLEQDGDAGVVAKMLCDDLEGEVKSGRPCMYFQPQYNNENQCIGAEALLRWNHPVYGMVYPPLVIKLLEETELLTKAEMVILETVMKEMDRIKETYQDGVKISVNVTGVTVQMDEYEDFLREMAERYPEHTGNIMIEITEQASLQIDEAFVARLTRVKEMGYRLAIDDFGMGNTSVKYLRSNVFDMIKLDGSLIQDIESNERSQGIVRNMVNMAQEFRIDILAEFVETREQQELLEELDCRLYQGYLYSPAVPLEKFLE